MTVTGGLSSLCRLFGYGRKVQSVALTPKARMREDANME